MILMITSCDIAPLLSMSTILKTFLMSLSVMGWPFTGLNLVQPASLIWSMIICNWLFMFFCCYCFFFIVPWTPWNQELCPSPLCTPTTAISPENVLEENIYLEKNIIIFILLLTNLRSFGSILNLIKIKDKNIIKKKDSKKFWKVNITDPVGLFNVVIDDCQVVHHLSQIHFTVFLLVKSLEHFLNLSVLRNLSGC